MKKSEFSISNEEKVKKIRSLKSIEILFLFFLRYLSYVKCIRGNYRRKSYDFSNDFFVYFLTNERTEQIKKREAVRVKTWQRYRKVQHGKKKY